MSLLLLAFVIGAVSAQAGYPTITVADQKGEKGGSISASFTLESSEIKLQQSMVHVDKATRDHKFTPVRFEFIFIDYPIK